MAIPGPDVAPVLVTTVLTLAVAGTVILRGPLGRTVARPIEGSAPLADGASDRIGERLDFTERMLTRSPAGLPLRAGGE
jgi:hypothetical protein